MYYILSLVFFFENEGFLTILFEALVAQLNLLSVPRANGGMCIDKVSHMPSENHKEAIQPHPVQLILHRSFIFVELISSFNGRGKHVSVGMRLLSLRFVWSV